MAPPILNNLFSKDIKIGDESERESLSSNLDWNNTDELEKYCQKQKKIEVERGFRPSEYFGAANVEELQDGVENAQIDSKNTIFT